MWRCRPRTKWVNWWEQMEKKMWSCWVYHPKLGWIGRPNVYDSYIINHLDTFDHDNVATSLEWWGIGVFLLGSTVFLLVKSYKWKQPVGSWGYFIHAVFIWILEPAKIVGQTWVKHGQTMGQTRGGLRMHHESFRCFFIGRHDVP